ncbi:MAG: glycosyltransferase [Candidatus Izemoplasmatales bacterium]|nr:glycosyltransferase [Candidatus Izemoplasmatales bacterium]
MVTKIFATVGSTYPLDRLTKELDSIGENKKYKIFAQIGESEYIPKNIEFTKFLTYQEMQSKIKWADLIISHAGAGSIIDLLISKNKFVLFPRLKQYNEAVDDHQLELCEAFNKKYKIKYSTNAKELVKLLDDKKLTVKIKKDSKLTKEIKKLIQPL